MSKIKKILLVIFISIVIAFLFLIKEKYFSSFEKNANIQAYQFSLGAFYYPWYSEQQWKTFKTTNTPERGFYNSSDSNIIREQLKLCEEAKINFLAYSWGGKNTDSDKVLRELFLPELALTPINFIILYETAGVLKLQAGKPLDFLTQTSSGKTAGDIFVEDIQYFSDIYFNNSSYQRINDKPILFIYLVRDMVNSDIFINKARELCRKKSLELFLIADIVYLNPAIDINWQSISKNFDAITGYNMYYEKLDEDGYLKNIENKFTEYYAEAVNNNLTFIPTVQPGYDDSNLRGKDRMIVKRDNGFFYTNYWQLSERYLDKKWPLMMLTSFNEWHEGTEVEPSKEYGKLYIKLTAELAARTKALFIKSSIQNTR